jgi:hypothetical protein
LGALLGGEVGEDLYVRGFDDVDVHLLSLLSLAV